MSQLLTARPRLRRATAASVAVGVVGSVGLAVSLGATLSGFTASIANPTNTAASAALAVEETSGGATCRSYDATATCSTINKYGGTTTPLVPGQSQTTTVTFTNTGSVDVASGTLTPGACSATSTGVTGAVTPPATTTDPGNLCSVLRVAIYQASSATGSPVFDGTVASLTSPVSLGALAKGTAQDYTFVVTLPSAATTAVQGQRVSQPLSWTFSQ